MISNWLAFSFAILEIFFYAGTCYGFGFMQYILEKEGVFWDEKCYDPEKHKSCTILPDGQIECSEEKETCEAMLASYNTVFTYFLLTSSLSGVFFDPIHQKFGTFAIRCILGGMTTLGLVLFIFYQDNSNIIYGVWQLIGLPSSFYIVTNTKELCPIFPKLQGLIIGLINGIFDASGGFFLIFKFIYEGTTVPLKTLLIGYAACSAIIWIKTFFFASKTFSTQNNDGQYSIFEDSFIGSLCSKDKKEKESRKNSSVSTSTKPRESWIKYALSFKYILSSIFYITLTIRTTSFPSWLYPWLRWSFSVLEESEAEEKVSLMMDIYGYSYFISLVIAPFPGLFISLMQKIYKSEKIGSHRALTGLLLFAITLGTIMSIQMCIQGSFINAVFLTLIFSMFRTLFFISKGMFLYAEFPAEHFGILYTVSLVPGAAINYLIDPLFKLILNGSDDIADANFVTISIAFAIMCGVSIYMPIYHHFFLGKAGDDETKASEDDSFQIDEKSDAILTHKMSEQVTIL